MTGQPVHGEFDVDDPAEILRGLPDQYREQFRTEYATAVERAQDPEGYRGLVDLLRLWRLRATAYAEPGYAARLAAARPNGSSEDVSAGEVIAGWPHR